jgi:hypothetical protein
MPPDKLPGSADDAPPELDCPAARSELNRAAVTTIPAKASVQKALRKNVRICPSHTPTAVFGSMVRR